VKADEAMQSIIELTNIFTICNRHSARFGAGIGAHSAKSAMT